jgi:hypothetical protein
MLAIEQVEYTIKHELLVRERFHLENLKATLNKQIPARTQQDLKQYHEEYNEANKTQIAEQKKQPITCECGKTVRKSDISKHNKTRYHQNYLTELPQVVPSEITSAIETVL